MTEQLGLTPERTNGLTVYDYCVGYTTFAFDLTPDASANEKHFSRVDKGNLWCNINFAAPFITEVTLIYYMEFEKMATIDSDRNVQLDAE